MAEEGVSGEHLHNLGTHRCTGPEGMCPRVLGELAGVIARLHLVTFEMSGQTGWEMADTAPIFKQGKKEHPWNYRLVSHISVPKNVME